MVPRGFAYEPICLSVPKKNILSLLYISVREERNGVCPCFCLFNEHNVGKAFFLVWLKRYSKSYIMKFCLSSYFCPYLNSFPKVGVLIVFTCLMADYQVISITLWCPAIIVLSELSVMSLCVTLARIGNRPMAIFLFLLNIKNRNGYSVTQGSAE